VFEIPPGQPSCKRRSGIPETLDVKAMVPLASAERGRPLGAKVTESVSTISTYISLEVWRTFARRQGTGEGAFATVGPRRGEGLEDSEKGVADCARDGAELCSCQIVFQLETRIGIYLGSPTLPNKFLMVEGASTTSLSAFGSVLAMIPPSTISLSNCATVS
jgi:hypothetical protein